MRTCRKIPSSPENLLLGLFSQSHPLFFFGSYSKVVVYTADRTCSFPLMFLQMSPRSPESAGSCEDSDPQQEEMVKRTQSLLHKPSKHGIWPDKAPSICMKQIKMLNKWKYSLLSRGWPRRVTGTGLCISGLPAISDLIFLLMIY